MEKNVQDFVGPLSIEEFKGGQSNPTYLVKTETQSYVLRRKPPGKLLKSAHAVDREHRVITALNNTDAGGFFFFDLFLVALLEGCVNEKLTHI